MFPALKNGYIFADYMQNWIKVRWFLVVLRIRLALCAVN